MFLHSKSIFINELNFMNRKQPGSIKDPRGSIGTATGDFCLESDTRMCGGRSQEMKSDVENA